MDRVEEKGLYEVRQKSNATGKAVHEQTKLLPPPSYPVRLTAAVDSAQFKLATVATRLLRASEVKLCL
jgi:hypothetical protein